MFRARCTKCGFDCLAVGNGGVPFGGVLFDVVVQNFTVNHLISNIIYQITVKSGFEICDAKGFSLF